MGLYVHLPLTQKSVAIPNYSSVMEMLKSNKEYIHKIATSHIYFRRIIGYSELLNRGIEKDLIDKHMLASTMMYANYLDLGAETDDEIEKALQEIILSDWFEEKYKYFISSLGGEIFRLFASGAVALHEGEVIVDELVYKTMAFQKA